MTPEKSELGPVQMDPAGLARFWSEQIREAQEQHKPFFERGEYLAGRYRAEKQSSMKARGVKQYQVFFSNVETLRGAVFSRPGKPDVRRRFPDQTPVFRDVADVVERALICLIDETAYERALEMAVDDALIVGRGVVRLEYSEQTAQQPVQGAMGEPLGDQTVVMSQELLPKYVYWQDFLHSTSRCWDDVWWIAFRHILTRDDLLDPANGFDPVAAEKAPMNWVDGGRKKERGVTPESIRRCEVWEIWHKTTKQRLFVVTDFPTPLKIEPDPYGLVGFYPTPGDLAFIRSSNNNIPTPDYEQYADQAADLDEIQERMSRLVRELKRRGVYDAAVPELGKMARAADNQFVAVQNYVDFAKKGGLREVFQTEDLQPAAFVLKELAQQRQLLIESIYEITGISDILRGSSDASETASAQQIKAQFGSMRLRRRQKLVQRYIRDLLRIAAEIMAERYEPEILGAKSGRQITPEVMQILREDRLRSYAIDIETDSTIFEDSEAEREQRTDALAGIANVVQMASPILMQSPTFPEFALEMLSFVTRGYKGARQFEDLVDKMKSELMQQQEMAAMMGPAMAPQMPMEEQGGPSPYMAEDPIAQYGVVGNA